MLFLNVQCLRNKVNILDASLIDHNFSGVGMCEHWLKEEEAATIKLDNYITVDYFARVRHVHGGVIQFLNPNIEYKTLSHIKKLSVELQCEITGSFLPKFDLFFIVIYRTPSGDINLFLELMTKLLNALDYKTKHIVVGGDFNAHLDIETCYKYW